MLARATCSTLAVLVVALAAPIGTAAAAVTVLRAAGDGVRVVGSDGVDDVILERTAGGLRVHGSGDAPASADGACAGDPALPGSLLCAVGPNAPVVVLLRGSADTFDARRATGVRISVNGGTGADLLRVGASGMTRITDPTARDTIDLSHADGGVRVRHERAVRRVVARCGSCSTAWAVMLPARPGRVLLGSGDDLVDLRGWSGVGRSTWLLGAGDDRFWGSPRRRAIVDGGAGGDVLVSFTAVDVLRGGAGIDKLADFGGTGDVLQGGPDFDFLGSLDGRRDRLDGQGGRDMCLSRRRPVSTCDTGSVRNIENPMYLPLVAATQRAVLRAMGIS